jgi:hypothetical protein
MKIKNRSKEFKIKSPGKKKECDLKQAANTPNMPFVQLRLHKQHMWAGTL